MLTDTEDNDTDGESPISSGLSQTDSELAELDSDNSYRPYLEGMKEQEHQDDLIDDLKTAIDKDDASWAKKLLRKI